MRRRRSVGIGGRSFTSAAYCNKVRGRFKVVRSIDPSWSQLTNFQDSVPCLQAMTRDLNRGESDENSSRQGPCDSDFVGLPLPGQTLQVCGNTNRSRRDGTRPASPLSTILLPFQ